MNSIDEIYFPFQTNGNTLKSTLEFLDKFITDIILYFAYISAILCIFKFVVYLINGFTTKSYMGTSALDMN